MPGDEAEIGTGGCAKAVRNADGPGAQRCPNVERPDQRNEKTAYGGGVLMAARYKHCGDGDQEHLQEPGQEWYCVGFHI